MKKPMTRVNDTLDDKLVKLIADTNLDFNKTQHYKGDKLVRDIKQAFADEGYLPHLDSGKHVKVDDKLYITNGSDPVVRIDLTRYVTGQEWFDKFQKELAETTKHWVFESFDRERVLEAARKASGAKG